MVKCFAVPPLICALYINSSIDQLMVRPTIQNIFFPFTLSSVVCKYWANGKWNWKWCSYKNAARHSTYIIQLKTSSETRIVVDHINIGLNITVYFSLLFFFLSCIVIMPVGIATASPNATILPSYFCRLFVFDSVFFSFHYHIVTQTIVCTWTKQWMEVSYILHSIDSYILSCNEIIREIYWNQPVVLLYTATWCFKQFKSFALFIFIQLTLSTLLECHFSYYIRFFTIQWFMCRASEREQW